MKTKLLMTLGFTGLLGAGSSTDLPKDMRRWLLEMHTAQIELLKIDWGNPGPCTEWDHDFHKASNSCGRRGKRTQRKSTE